jgi:hypothetical protein
VPLQFLQAAGAGSQIWCVVCVFSGLLCSVLTLMSGICIVCCFVGFCLLAFQKKNELETSKILTNRKDPKKEKNANKKRKKKNYESKSPGIMLIKTNQGLLLWIKN